MIIETAQAGGNIAKLHRQLIASGHPDVLRPFTIERTFYRGKIMTKAQLGRLTDCVFMGKVFLT